MKRIIGALALLAILTIALGTASIGLAEAVQTTLPQLDDCFTERDLTGDWDATATQILLTGDSAETSSHVVSIDGGEITLLDGGVYVLSGTLDDGTIIVDIEDDERVQLVLNGVEITSSDSAAINVVQADKVFITLAEGTENTLRNGGSFAEDSIDAVITSDEDLTFNGTGTLIIESPAGDGIDGKDDVKFASGTYVITAAGRGIDANDSVRIAGGDFTIITDGDAIRARHENNSELGYIYIWDGAFEITTGGGAVNGNGQSDSPMMPEGFGFQGEAGEMPEPPEGFTEGAMPEPGDGGMPTPPEGMPEIQAGNMPEPSDDDSDEDAVSAKGFKASGNIVVLGGRFTLDTVDDAFHADGDLLVFDGSLTIASGDDGLHADKALTILGGSIDITQSSEGLESQVISIAGGDTSLVASDDGLNAASSTGEKESFDAQDGVIIEISGGTLYVNASGDGIDSNGDILISGGTVVVSGPTNGMNGALDYNGTATITGGTIIAAGASGMAENLSGTSTQAAFLVNLTGGAGEITVTDEAGTVLLTGTVEKNFGTVVISCPGLAVGGAYTVSCGDSAAEITLTDTVTGADEGGMAGPMQGMGMGRGPDAKGAEAAAQEAATDEA